MTAKMNREELFERAFKENDQMIYRLCYHYFGPGDNANDAHQEILLKIWLNIQNFRGEAALKTWIYRITVNVCITFLTKAKKKSSVFIPFSKYVDTDAYRIDEDHIDKTTKIQFFRKFMEELNKIDKALVSLYLEELNTKEISRITGISESNVRVKIHRIKNDIKNRWEKEYGT